MILFERAARVLSFGTNTFLTGIATMIGLPIWGIAMGNWEVVGAGFVIGLVATFAGYGLIKLEEPPKPPEP